MDQAIKKISTYAELQEEKSKLKEEIRFSKDQLLHSWGNTRTIARDLLLKGVALPAGVAGLAVAGVKVAQSLRGDHTEQPAEAYNQYDETEPASILETLQNNLAASSKWYLRIVPVAVQLIRNYIINRNQNDQSYQQQDWEDANTYPAESATRLPVAISGHQASR